jgi:hypothetical protein
VLNAAWQWRHFFRSDEEVETLLSWPATGAAAMRADEISSSSTSDILLLLQK